MLIVHVDVCTGALQLLAFVCKHDFRSTLCGQYSVTLWEWGYIYHIVKGGGEESTLS